MKWLLPSIILCILFSWSTSYAEGARAFSINYDLDLLENSTSSYKDVFFFYKDKLIIRYFGKNCYEIYSVFEKSATKCKAIYGITYYDNGTFGKGTQYEKIIDVENDTVLYYSGNAESMLYHLLKDATLRKILNNEPATAMYKGKPYTYHSAKNEILNAANDGDIEKIRLCLERGASVNVQRDLKLYTPLHNAVEHGHLEAAIFLMDHGAHLNARTRLGWTPLYVAAKNGYLSIVQELVRRGASPTLLSYSGVSPRRIAAERGHPEIAEFLSVQQPPVERSAPPAPRERTLPRASDSASLDAIIEKATAF